MFIDGSFGFISVQLSHKKLSRDIRNYKFYLYIFKGPKHIVNEWPFIGVLQCTNTNVSNMFCFEDWQKQGVQDGRQKKKGGCVVVYCR